jgi:hypothetical protein
MVCVGSSTLRAGKELRTVVRFAPCGHGALNAICELPRTSTNKHPRNAGRQTGYQGCDCRSGVPALVKANIRTSISRLIESELLRNAVGQVRRAGGGQVRTIPSR